MLDAANHEPSEASISAAQQGRPYRGVVLSSIHRLVWAGGMAGVLLDDTGSGELVEADGADPDLRVVRGEHETRVSQRGTFWRRALDSVLYGLDPEPHVRVRLHRDCDWSLACRGGVSNLDARLDDLRLTSVTLAGGVRGSYLSLGTPRTRASICISGGASGLEIQRPFGVGLRLRIRGGVSNLVFDEMELEAVGGPLDLASTDLASQGGFYDLEIRGGASDLLLTTR